MDIVRGGNVGEQRVAVDGAPAIVVGVPIPSIEADLFEVRTLSDLQQTLGTLAGILAGTAVATTMAGCLLGWWASRRLMRPLTGIATVATAIAGGDLERRLPVDLDPDLGSLATAFNEMVVSLEQRIQRDARFASDVSHELRSPLTAVNTSVDLMEVFRDSLPPEGQQALYLLHVEVNRLSTMVQDLLEMSRMEAGAPGLEIEEVSLDQLVERAVAGRARHVTVRVAPSACDTVLHLDKRLLQRVLANILDNADAYAGGAVLVTVERNGSRCFIGIEDEGPGIPVGEEEQIFERFFRGNAAGRRGSTRGSGLGLALAAEHMRAHGGSITVENRTEGGTRFIITLPVTNA